jgi:RNA methyltransferase, TrmH family
MISINKTKYVQSLHHKKTRQKYNNFIAEGDKIGYEIIKSGKLKVEGIFAVPQWLEQYATELKKFQSIITEISEAELKKISTLTTPNQVLIVAEQPSFDVDYQLLSQDLVLYLDGIQDPGNMGTILRIADWFGINYVFCSDTCVDAFNPKVVQATMGAFLRIKTKEIELKALLTETTPVYGALLEGKNIFQIPLSKHGVIVIGNEGKGISDSVRAHVNRPILIPPHGEGAESLNAAVATGIICAAFRNL